MSRTAGGKPEVAINIDRESRRRPGAAHRVHRQHGTQHDGRRQVSEISSDGQRWDVRLRLDEAFRPEADDLLAFKIRSTLVNWSTCFQRVSITPGTGPAQDRPAEPTAPDHCLRQPGGRQAGHGVRGRGGSQESGSQTMTPTGRHGRHHARVVWIPLRGHHASPSIIVYLVLAAQVRKLPAPLHHHAVAAAIHGGRTGGHRPGAVRPSA